jgi:ABC-type transport system substrate-binding protein
MTGAGLAPAPASLPYPLPALIRILGQTLLSYPLAAHRTKVSVLEPSQRSQLLRANTFPGLLLADPASTTYDADGVLWRLRGPGGILHQSWPGNYEGTPFYKLMEEARVTLDVQKRLRNYQEAAQIWHDEAPELFLFQGEMIDGVRNEVKYQARGDQRIILYDISYR